MKPKVGIVVQRFGEEVIGGAEGLAREVALHMCPHWDLTVMTTCAKDYRTWENVYPEGRTEDCGFNVIRFASVKQRNLETFSDAFAPKEKFAFRLSPEEELEYFQEQGPFCPKLVEYLGQHQADFDFFLFFTYLYYPTAFGLPKVAAKSYLVSTAHDEPPFYFVRTYAPIFNHLRGIIYLSDEEQRLINRVYNVPEHVKQIHGVYGVPNPQMVSADEQSSLYKKFPFARNECYFIYVGRASNTKKCGDLIDAFLQLTGDYNIPAKFVFAGTVDIKLPVDRPDILALGYLTEKEKSFLLSHAAALVNPSSLESLSMVVLEAWRHGTFVIVNGHSEVMRAHCDRTGAGVYYHSLPMLKGLMAWTFYHTGEAKQLATLGKRYVEEKYNWDEATKLFLHALR